MAEGDDPSPVRERLDSAWVTNLGARGVPRRPLLDREGGRSPRRRLRPYALAGRPVRLAATLALQLSRSRAYLGALAVL